MDVLTHQIDRTVGRHCPLSDAHDSGQGHKELCCSDSIEIVDLAGRDDSDTEVVDITPAQLRNSTSNSIAAVVAPYLQILQEIARTHAPRSVKVAEANPMILCSTFFDPANGEMERNIDKTSIKKMAFLAAPETGWQCPLTYRYCVVNAVVFGVRESSKGPPTYKTAFSMCMLRYRNDHTRPFRYAVVFVAFTLCHEKLAHAILFDFTVKEVLKGWVPFDKRRAHILDCGIDLSEYYCDVGEPLYKPESGRTIEPKDIWGKGLDYLKIYGFIFRKERLIHIDSESAYKVKPADGSSDFARTDEEAEFVDGLTAKERQQMEDKVAERAKLYRLNIRNLEHGEQDSTALDGKTRSQRKRLAAVLREQTQEEPEIHGEQGISEVPTALQNKRKESTKPKRQQNRKTLINQNPANLSVDKPKTAPKRATKATGTSAPDVAIVVDDSHENSVRWIPPAWNPSHHASRNVSISTDQGFREGLVQGQQSFLEHLKGTQEKSAKREDDFVEHLKGEQERDHKRKLEMQAMADNHEMAKLREKREFKINELREMNRLEENKLKIMQVQQHSYTVIFIHLRSSAQLSSSKHSPLFTTW